MRNSSLLYWYPKVKNLGIPTPKTEIVELKHKNNLLLPVCDGDFSPIEPQWSDILEKARKIGFPLFMRTDEFSGKHGWKNTCYVEKESDLKKHISTLIEESFLADMMGLPIRALVFRKYIPMKSMFTAFYGEMPVNPEIRLFAKEGDILCWHWYWINDAIEQGTRKEDLPPDWKKQLSMAKKEMTSKDINDLMFQASEVSKQFKGIWSIDFCLSKKGIWYLIDMAEGHLSWHPEDCENEKKIRADNTKDI